MKNLLYRIAAVSGICLLLLSFRGNLSKSLQSDWPEYLGGADRNHYSSLSNINTGNVKSLKPVWEFHTGDSGQVQCNPIIIENRLYAVTASNHLFSLNAATGQELWRFSPESKGASNVNRGVAYWSKGKDKRIMFAFQTWLYAVNAITGKPILSFGDQGRVSLKSGLGEESATKFVSSTTPGTIFGDLIIMPMRLGEGTGSAPGYIQAFNVRSGKLSLGI
jgi:quinoprotein glucose dehydrogenase